MGQPQAKLIYEDTWKKRRRIRGSLNRVDPRNTALGWGVVSGKVYFVPWLNSLWHLGGHRSIIRRGFVIHGCIDGYSRRIIFLHCSTNNLSPTVLGLFDSAIVIAMFLVTSPIVINVPIRGLLAVETMHAINSSVVGKFEYQNKYDVNVCKQEASL